MPVVNDADRIGLSIQAKFVEPPRKSQFGCVHRQTERASVPNDPSLDNVAKDMGKTKHYCWAGAMLGAALFFVLAVTDVLVSVPTQIDGQGRFRYEVVILGVEVFRYPDDGELYRMRPFPQAISARQHLIAASTIVGAIVGCGVAFVLHRFLLRRARTEGLDVARDP